MSIPSIGAAIRVEPVSPTAISIQPVMPVDTGADAASISRNGALLGQLSEHARAAPERFRALMSEGARAVEEAITDGHLVSGDAYAFADALGSAAASADAEPLRAVLAAPDSSDEARRVTAALQSRLEAVFGFRLAPLGPWFPRDRPLP